MPTRHAGRLQLPHGGGSRRRRATAPNDIVYFGMRRAGPLDRLGRELHRPGRACTPTRTPGRSSRSRRRRRRSSTAATTAASSAPPTAAPPGRRSTSAACRPACSTTSPSGPTRRRACTLGALQDNGIQTTAGAASPSWNSPQGGDGWDVAYDGGDGRPGVRHQRLLVPGSVHAGLALRRRRGELVRPRSRRGARRTDAGCYLAPIADRPERRRHVYVSGNQNLWQSQDAGATWRNIGAFPVHPTVASHPSNGNNVVVAVGTQVFVSTNALAATVGAPNGVTFTDITRNLPGRNVLRGGLRSERPDRDLRRARRLRRRRRATRPRVPHDRRAARRGQDISPALDVPFGALALDGSDTPTTIYVGTDLGVLRSVDDGATWTVLDDIHFPRAPGHRPGALAPGRRAARRHVRPRRLRVPPARTARRSP